MSSTSQSRPKPCSATLRLVPGRSGGGAGACGRGAWKCRVFFLSVPHQPQPWSSCMRVCRTTRWRWPGYLAEVNLSAVPAVW